MNKDELTEKIKEVLDISFRNITDFKQFAFLMTIKIKVNNDLLTFDELSTYYFYLKKEIEKYNLK